MATKERHKNQVIAYLSNDEDVFLYELKQEFGMKSSSKALGKVIQDYRRFYDEEIYEYLLGRADTIMGAAVGVIREAMENEGNNRGNGLA